MIKLRHYQKGVRPALVKHHKETPERHPLIAMPTGSGKSYSIADVIGYFHKKWGTKILVLSHVKEILAQNAKSIETYTGLSVGVYSAGLGKKEVKDVTVAGIQSVFRSPEVFSDYKLIIVDEAHLIPINDESMYKKFLMGLPGSMVVGFTATPFRLGTGYIYGNPDSLFDDLIYDWTSKDRFNQLVDEGFLAPLTAERTSLEMDTTGIKLKGGDYSLNELSSKFDVKGVTNEAIKEIMAAGVNRKQWMVFGIDINHANHIAETLNRNGIRTAVVHSKMSEYGFDRDKVIQDVRNGLYRCVVNVDVLTIGFDCPSVDLIALLRPTKSPVLHVQIMGRGSRVCENKLDCLVLDFAGNVASLGPINDVNIVIKGKGKGGGEPITKPCPKCNLIVHASVRVCPRCLYKFPREHHLSANAGNADVIDDGQYHWLSVDEVSYKHNAGMGRPSTMIVTYHCGVKKITEHICVEHRGFAKQKADHWVKFRGGVPCNKVADLMPQIERLKTPTAINVVRKGKYYNITDSKF